MNAPSWDKIFGGRSRELVSGFKFQEVRYLKYETGKNTTLKNIPKNSYTPKITPADYQNRQGYFATQ